MKVLKMVRRLALVLLVICAGFCLVVGVKGYRMYKGALAQTSLADKVDSIRAREDYTSFEELPPIYVEAVLSVEDHRFYSHPGIDPIAIGRAVCRGWKHHYPAAGQESVFFPGEGADPQGGGDVHGL